MEFTRWIFPAPNPSYQANTFDTLIWIHKFKWQVTNQSTDTGNENAIHHSVFPWFSCFASDSGVPREVRVHDRSVPCLFFPYDEGSNKILLYFHGNAEDIGLTYSFLTMLSFELKIHILAIEYPGYGLYPGCPCAETIAADALLVYDFLTQNLGWPEEDIIVMGRSMGSGPAHILASRRKPAALMLMAAYSSIRTVAKDMVGSVLQYLVKDSFRNIDEISKVKCPILIVHGENDEIVPASHAISLMHASTAPCTVMIKPKMTHNKFDVIVDLLQPIEKFMKDHNLEPKIMNDVVPKFPEENKTKDNPIPPTIEARPTFADPASLKCYSECDILRSSCNKNPQI